MHTTRSKSITSIPSTDPAKIIEALFRTHELLGSGARAPEIAAELHRLIGDVIPCDVFAVALCQQPNHLNVIYFQAGGKRHPNSVYRSDGLTREAISKKRSIISNNGHQLADSITNLIDEGGRRKTPRSIIVVPIVLQEKVVGVVCAESHAAEAYSSDDSTWLTIISRLTAPVFGKYLDGSKGRGRKSNESYDRIIQKARKVGHEMNQPLTGIAGYCTFVMEGIDKTNAIYKDLQQIEEQAKRLEQLVFDFQSLFRPTSSPKSKKARSKFTPHK
jgi:transcriptional regulator with GAF, ATPase, and Fis domain